MENSNALCKEALDLCKKMLDKMSGEAYEIALNIRSIEERLEKEKINKDPETQNATSDPPPKQTPISPAHESHVRKPKSDLP